MSEAMDSGPAPRRSGRAYKYVFILVCVVVAWLALRVEERPDQRAARRAPQDESAAPVPSAPTPAPAAGKAVALTADTFRSAVAGGVYVVDFWAEWCGPCRTQGPIIEQLARSHAGSVGVGKIDVDSEDELAERFGIRSIPTIIVFKNGKEEARFVGVTSRDVLSEAVESLM